MYEPDSWYYRQIYQELTDDFDFILEIYNVWSTPAHIPYSGAAYVQSNKVTGIGRDLFSSEDTMGSSGKLKSIISVPREDGLEPLQWNLLLHEMLHTWANYGIDTEYFDANNQPVNDWSHWGYSGAGLILRGFDQTTLRSHVDGDSLKYSYTPPENPFLTRYSFFELYLMGLIPLEEVPTFDVFTNLISKDGDYSFRAKTRTTYDHNKIIKVLGERSPSWETSQKHFKMLVVVFTIQPLTDVEKNRMNFLAEQFSRTGPDDFEDRINFWEATGGKATISIDEASKSLK